MLIGVGNFKPQSPLKFQHTFPTVQMNSDFTIDLTELLFSLFVDFDLFGCVTLFNLCFHLLYVIVASLVRELFRNFLLYVLIKS